MAFFRWYGLAPSADELAALAQAGWQGAAMAELPVTALIIRQPQLSDWAAAIAAYRGQPLYARGCPWPLPRHLQLPADLQGWVPLAVPFPLAGDCPLPALNQELLVDYLDMLGADTLAASVALLGQYLPTYLEQLVAARASGDDDAERRAAHVLKGAFATVALARVRDWAEILQSAPAGVEREQALTDLLSYCGRDLEQLSRYLAAANR